MSKKAARRCRQDKQRYPSLKAAQAAAAAMARRKAKAGNPIVTFLRAYGCTCGGFHFGNTRDIDWSLVSQRSKVAASPVPNTKVTRDA